MDYKKLANLLYGDVTKTPEDYFAMYPARDLPKGAEVTRLGPSPTGYLHTGHLFGAMIDKFVADQSNGVFYLRLEDTDNQRRIEGAEDVAVKMLKTFNCTPEEGFMGSQAEQVGAYGNYVQSKRVEIYRAFAKRITENGRAFPCFCAASAGKADIKQRREKQIEETGNIVDHDPCRNLTLSQIEENLSKNMPWALKLLSKGSPKKTFEFVDLIKGKRELHENCKDVVLMKSNQIPPYAFAHVVDDTLMHTTIVVRGEDWWASLPAHLEIFDALGLKPMRYAHTPNISKIDSTTGNKRKLSKRYDPEANVGYFLAEGYPTVALNEYLLGLINSDFENWRRNNPNLLYTDFPLSIKKITLSNPMFDLVKVNDISKNIISKIPADTLYSNIKNWAKEFDPEFFDTISAQEDFVIKLLSIDRDGARPRKDISHYSEVKGLYSYMFKQYFEQEATLKFELDVGVEKIKEFLNAYKSAYTPQSDKNVWFEKLSQVAFNCGFATTKEYKANPNQYAGSIADASNILRVAITGRSTTPDLCAIMNLLGQAEVNSRIEYVVSNLK